MSRLGRLIRRIGDHYRFFELWTTEQRVLPAAPTNHEKYLYLKRNHRLLLAASSISFGCYLVSVSDFLLDNRIAWSYLAIVALTVLYFAISFTVNAFTNDFDFRRHRAIRKRFTPTVWPTVDIFLPTAGEPLDVLENTWKHIEQLRAAYSGQLTVYVLDDSARQSVAALAARHQFVYSVRPNRGWFKKAGNLRHGFQISNGDFIVVFDADFCPRPDFISELLPYMYRGPRIGIVQSPQFFRVGLAQNWLERGAGAVQELFYRFSQVSRQNHHAAICVGTNAIYRRAALQDTGGTALIEHSEDVHTGFNLRMYGWSVYYVPLNLASGICPDTMTAFFKQQYRWCMGSMSLLSSGKFWKTKLGVRGRLSYMSGFGYYVSTAVASLSAPAIPLLLLTRLSGEVALRFSLLILPAFLFAWVVYPLWHRCTYGVEAWSTRNIYGWAHLFAIVDILRGRPMGWQPTGAVKKADHRYVVFRALQFGLNFVPATLWVSLALYDVLTRADGYNFVPLLISGSLYLSVVSKVTVYGLGLRLALGKNRLALMPGTSGSSST